MSSEHDLMKERRQKLHFGLSCCFSSVVSDKTLPTLNKCQGSLQNYTIIPIIIITIFTKAQSHHLIKIQTRPRFLSLSSVLVLSSVSSWLSELQDLARINWQRSPLLEWSFSSQRVKSCSNLHRTPCSQTFI